MRYKPPLPAPFPAVVKLLPESQPEPKPSSVAQEHFSCWWDWIQISPCCSPFFFPFFLCMGVSCTASEQCCLWWGEQSVPGWGKERYGQALPG